MTWGFGRLLADYWPDLSTGRACHQRIATILCLSGCISLAVTALLLSRQQQEGDAWLVLAVSVAAAALLAAPAISARAGRPCILANVVLSIKILTVALVHFRLDNGIAIAAFMILELGISVRLLGSQRQMAGWLSGAVILAAASMVGGYGPPEGQGNAQTRMDDIWYGVFFPGQIAGVMFCLAIADRYFWRKTGPAQSGAPAHPPNAALQRNLFQEATHELRTPMNGIMGMGQLLQNTDMTDQQQSFVDTILASSHQLLLLINELVDYEKVRSGSLKLQPRPVELRKLISKTHARLSAIAEQRHIKIVSIFEEAAENWYEVDEARLEQVIFNIGRHVLNRANRGEILLHVGALRNQSLRVEVSCRANVKPSPQADMRPLDPAVGGDGLGLSMAQALLSLMGIELHVDALAQNKVAYRFYIKAKPVPAPVEDGSSRIQDTAFAPRRPLNILVVEDNEANREMLREALQAEHVTIHEASLVWQAEQILAKTHHIDIILLDLKLPDENGIELLRRIRQPSNYYAKVPVVVLTATGDEGKLAAIRALGVKAIITKPVPLYRIFRHLNSISQENLGARIDIHDVIA